MKPVFLTDSQIATLRLALADQCVTTDPRSNKDIDLELLADFRRIHKASAELLAALDLMTASPHAAALMFYLSALEGAGFTVTMVNNYSSDDGRTTNPPQATTSKAEAARLATRSNNALLTLKHGGDARAFAILTDTTGKPAEIITDYTERRESIGVVFSSTIERALDALETLSVPHS